MSGKTDWREPFILGFQGALRWLTYQHDTQFESEQEQRRSHSPQGILPMQHPTRTVIISYLVNASQRYAKNQRVLKVTSESCLASDRRDSFGGYGSCGGDSRHGTVLSRCSCGQESRSRDARPKSIP